MNIMALHGRYTVLSLLSIGLVCSYFTRRLLGLSSTKVEQRMQEVTAEADQVWSRLCGR